MRFTLTHERGPAKQGLFKKGGRAVNQDLAQYLRKVHVSHLDLEVMVEELGSMIFPYESQVTRLGPTAVGRNRVHIRTL